jgi:hypothetical protein
MGKTYLGAVDLAFTRLAAKLQYDLDCLLDTSGADRMTACLKTA